MFFNVLNHHQSMKTTIRTRSVQKYQTVLELQETIFVAHQDLAF